LSFEVLELSTAYSVKYGKENDKGIMTRAITTAPTVTITNPINDAKVPASNPTVSDTSRDNDGGSGVNNVPVQVDSAHI
jgi:hypothetical protein